MDFWPTLYLEKNIIENKNSVYDHVIYDSDVKKGFAEQLKKDPEVELYTKLLGWFKIDTLLGGYNPDLAVLINKNNERKIYFVVETKGNVDSATLRPTEKAKIKCGKRHFAALNKNINFEAIDDYNNFKSST